MRINTLIGAPAAIFAAWLCLPGAAAADEAADAALMTNLGLMRSHLFVGMELTKAGDAKQASLHFHHPKAELYGDIEAA